VKRFSHDLAGCGQRIAKLDAQWTAHLQDVSQIWQDEVARNFLDRQLEDVSPRVNLLLSEIAAMTESLESMVAQLQDPDFR
jgi:hypothetical protein